MTFHVTGGLFQYVRICGICQMTIDLTLNILVRQNPGGVKRDSADEYSSIL